MQGCNVVTRFYFLFAIFFAMPGMLVFSPQTVSAQPVASTLTDPVTRPRQVLTSQIYLTPPALSGNIETANGQYRINLVNLDPSRVVRGYAVINLGSVEEQTEAIKLRFTLAPQEGMLYPLWPLAATGEYYTLMIYDLRGVMIFQKIAPVRRGTEANWTVAAPVTAIVSPRLVATSPAPGPEAEIKVQAKLAGGENENDPFYLALDLSAPHPIIGAGITVTGKGINQHKVADIKGTALIKFKLPDDLPEQKLSYLITDSTGRLLARGEADLHTLLADDYVSVSEVKPDRQAYAPGEQAKLSVNLQGNSPNGYRLEVLAKDSKGTIFFRDARKSEAGGGNPGLEFTLALPRETSGSVTFSYKVFDAKTGKLFDSGDTEIVVTEPKGAAPQ